MPRFSVFPTFLREILLRRPLSRVPEPTMAMDGAEQVEAYASSGRADGVMAAASLFHSALVSTVIGKCGANIVEVYHQRGFTVLPAKGAELHVVIETRDREHLQRVVSGLERAGYAVAMKGAGSTR